MKNAETEKNLKTWLLSIWKDDPENVVNILAKAQDDNNLDKLLTTETRKALKKLTIRTKEAFEKSMSYHDGYFEEL